MLVEPIPDGEALLECNPANYTYVNCGLGAQSGRLTLNRYNNEKLDSFLEMHRRNKEVSESRRLVERIEVAVRTLDDIIEEYCASDSIGIKIDTEGFELEVIKGLERHKERVTFIVAESSVRRHLDTYSILRPGRRVAREELLLPQRNESDEGDGAFLRHSVCAEGRF